MPALPDRGAVARRHTSASIKLSHFTLGSPQTVGFGSVTYAFGTRCGNAAGLGRAGETDPQAPRLARQVATTSTSQLERLGERRK